jgi:hypothetical protein
MTNDDIRNVGTYAAELDAARQRAAERSREAAARNPKAQERRELWVLNRGDRRIRSA